MASWWFSLCGWRLTGGGAHARRHRPAHVAAARSRTNNPSLPALQTSARRTATHTYYESKLLNTDAHLNNYNSLHSQRGCTTLFNWDWNVHFDLGRTDRAQRKLSRKWSLKSRGCRARLKRPSLEGGRARNERRSEWRRVQHLPTSPPCTCGAPRKARTRHAYATLTTRR